MKTFLEWAGDVFGALALFGGGYAAWVILWAAMGGP